MIKELVSWVQGLMHECRVPTRLSFVMKMINNFIQKQYKPSHRVYEHHRSKHGIYLGDIAASQDTEFIKENGIKTVVTAALGMDTLSFDSSIRHIVYPLLDGKSQNIAQFFMHFNAMVDQELERGSILVHCFAGISRSATLVIAYLMHKYNWSFKTAIEYVRKTRPTICPNLGFERQLKQFEKFVKGNSPNSITERKFASKTSQSSNHDNRNADRKVLPELNLERLPQRGKALEPTIIGFPERPKKNTISIDLDSQQSQQRKARIRPLLKIRSNSYGANVQYAKRNIRLKRQSNPTEDIKLAIMSKLGLGGIQGKFYNEKSISNPRIAHQRFPMIVRN